MKNLSADPRSSQKNFLELEEKSRLDFVELNRDRAMPQVTRPSPRLAKTDKQVAIAQRNGYRNFPQPVTQPNSVSFWDRIPPWLQLGSFFLVAAGLVVAVLKFPAPSINEQPLSNEETPTQPQSVVPFQVSPSPFPQPQALPSPVGVPSPQLSPQPEVPLPDSLTSSSLPNSQNQPLSTGSSPAEIPNPNPDLNIEPSLSGGIPAQPPSLPSDAVGTPSSPCSCSASDCHQAVPAAGKADQNARVTEVRSYFQERWQSPSGLKQTLEYSVLLNSDGTIQRITPLSNAAVDYMNSTNMPLPGTPLVSSIQGGGKTSIHVALSPDGKVNTSLE
ncbi:MAG: hypothetical protein AB1589_11195 [Cyanobacteriota bacterium]